jgi:hypothetical protein
MSVRCAPRLVSLVLLTLGACSPSTVTPPSTVPVDAATLVDVAALDASAEDVATDAGAADVPAIDEAPSRLPTCTNQFGHDLTRSYGRLDGHLVAIVPAGRRDCNGDPDHMHLQISVGAGIYDVAVNLGARPVGGVPDLSIATDDLPLPDGPWVEGWHTAIAPLDYVTTLHLHSGDFTPLAPADVSLRLESELRDVGRISVFATGYGPDGAHNVHRNQGLDGALALHPMGARAHLLLFHFASQRF